jgi:hypothetical protein
MINRILLFTAVLLFSISVSAQKARQILVVADTGVARDRLVNVLRWLPSGGVINVMSSLPSGDLNLSYDAILMIRPARLNPWLSPIDETRLYHYIAGGGRFYMEGSSFRGEAKLWDFIGDSAEVRTSSTVHVDSVYGIEGTFAEGVTARQPFDPLREDALDGLHIRGSLVGVLGVVGNHGSPIAWQASDTSIKAVLLWPIAGGYYEQFVTRVVCAYFGMCTLGHEEESQDESKLSFDPAQSELHLPAVGFVTISDILGRVVFEFDASDLRIKLPSLLAGPYIASWRNASDRASLTFIIN